MVKYINTEYQVFIRSYVGCIIILLLSIIREIGKGENMQKLSFSIVYKQTHKLSANPSFLFTYQNQMNLTELDFPACTSVA